jgi:hypothetical protein
MRGSPDGKAYFVSQGASLPDPAPRDANLSWITGDQVFLARVKPTLANMNNRAAYEYFAGKDKHNRDHWTSDLRSSRPIVDWNNHVGNVSVTYDSPLRKYLMVITDGGNTIGKYNTYILESARLTGPWKLVTYMRAFGPQAYFVNIPSKFISKNGLTLWLSYSANFTNSYLHTGFEPNPPGSGYGLSLQEVRLLSHSADSH